MDTDQQSLLIALYIKVYAGDVETVERILRTGVSLSTVVPDMESSLKLAVKLHRTEIVQLLLERDADPTSVDNSDRPDLLYKQVDEGNDKTVARILQAKISPNTVAPGREALSSWRSESAILP